MNTAANDPSIAPAIRTDAVAPITTATSATPAPVRVTATGATTSSVVEFSPLARLLAATVQFQSQPGNQVQAGGAAATTSADLQQLVNAANSFVNAFNAFQNTINANTATPFESAFDKGILTALQTQSTLGGSNSVQSFIDSLTQLGINFQGSAAAANPNQFQFDLNTLQSAFNANPVNTATQLSNTFQALNIIEENLTKAQGNAPAMLDPATRDPIVAQAVAAYRVAENSVHSAAATTSTTVIEAVPDITKVDRIEPIGANTP